MESWNVITRIITKTGISAENKAFVEELARLLLEIMYYIQARLS